MSDSTPDAMVIQASGFGPAMTARQSIERAKKIMLDLEAISPWRRPSKVSGRTEETDNMPIAEDLADFDEVVMRALQSYDDVRYQNENDASNWRLTPDSHSPYGFRETFSDIHTGEGFWDSVTVSLHSAGEETSGSCDNSVYVVAIPFYARDQINAAWSEPATVQRIFDYFIDSYDPMKCVVFGSDQALALSKQGDRYVGSYTLGWLNYTKNAEVAGVFRKTGKAVPYRRGTLLKLGDDASALSDPKVEAELAGIGEMLRAAGVKR